MKMNQKSSQYITGERRAYALYTLVSRAIPYASDGLKNSGRRVLWTARDGKTYKTATLAGATMPIHPHGDQSLQGAINTLAAPYGNNIPLLSGDGAFGTILAPTAYGAARYTSVHISKFCKDVVLRDIEIVPMVENYDGTLMEPKHFLPLIPIALLNPQKGIAVGFASDILPRSLETIIKSQLMYLEENKVRSELPNFTPINQKAIKKMNGKGNARYLFRGEFERIGTTKIRITNLPYGITHEKYTDDVLASLKESAQIKEVEDNSRDKYNIVVTFHKGVLRKMTDEKLIQLLRLERTESENLNLIDFDGERVVNPSYEELIAQFCDWRLGWYKTRYERLAANLEAELQRYLDILRAIAKNVGGVAKKTSSRGELKTFLSEIGIINIDYIADLPVYRFTTDEKEKVEGKLKEAKKTLAEYKALLNSEEKRKKVFVDELKEVLSNKKSYYDR